MAGTWDEIWNFGLTDEDRGRISKSIAFDSRGRLHKEDGPAITFESGAMFFWHGTLVPEDIIMGQVTRRKIMDKENVEIRRCMIERYGLERFLKKFKPIDQSEFGRLYHFSLDSKPMAGSTLPMAGSTLAWVVVRNSTPEPDGTFKDYILRVDPQLKTAKAAVASTFGMTPEEYKLLIET